MVRSESTAKGSGNQRCGYKLIKKQAVIEAQGECACRPSNLARVGHGAFGVHSQRVREEEVWMQAVVRGGAGRVCLQALIPGAKIVAYATKIVAYATKVVAYATMAYATKINLLNLLHEGGWFSGTAIPG